MGFVSETSVKAVRKRHVCDGCGQYIEAGGRATRWAGLTEGDFGTAIYHPTCRIAEVAYNHMSGWQYGDDWYPLTEMDSDDWPWLRETYPEVADRMGVMPPAENNAHSPSEASASAPSTDEPIDFPNPTRGET